MVFAGAVLLGIVADGDLYAVAVRRKQRRRQPGWIHLACFKFPFGSFLPLMRSWKKAAQGRMRLGGRHSQHSHFAWISNMVSLLAFLACTQRSPKSPRDARPR